jgi:hypothetical protein
MVATVITLAASCLSVGVPVFAALTSGAIGLLLFLRGARLSRAAVITAVSLLRLQRVIFAATFSLSRSSA